MKDEKEEEDAEERNSSHVAITTLACVLAVTSTEEAHGLPSVTDFI